MTSILSDARGPKLVSFDDGWSIVDPLGGPIPKSIPYQLNFDFDLPPTYSHTIFYQYIVAFITFNELDATSMFIEETKYNISFTYALTIGEQVVIPYMIRDATNLTVRTTILDGSNLPAIKINVELLNLGTSESYFNLPVRFKRHK
jgi:hypothetical protein